MPQTPACRMAIGETYGQTQLTMTFNGASLEACSLVRWMQAALDGPSMSIRSACILPYAIQAGIIQLKVPWPGADSPPPSVVVTSTVWIPAIEAILITRDGMSALVPLSNNGPRPTVI